MLDYSPSLNGVASQVHSPLRKYHALDYFRDRVREAAREYLEAMAECERREKLRREVAAKEGVWQVLVDAAVAKRKLEERCFRWQEVFQGRIMLPSGIKKPLMGLTGRAEYPNRPIEPRCFRDRIVRGEWSKRDEREVEEFNKKLKEWEEEKAAYVTGPKKKGKWQMGPSKLESDWRPIFELAQKRSFPDDGDGGFPYTFTVEAWLPGNLSEDNDPATDGPLPVSKNEEKTLLNSKYAGLAAIYDAHWGGSERIAPWGVVKTGGKVSPASGLPSEWKTPEEPGSYRAASWYWRLVMAAKELDARNTTIVGSWVGDVEADLAKAFPKRATATSTKDTDARRRAPRGPTADECKALFVALLTLLPDKQHHAVVYDWGAQRIVDEIAERLKPARAPTARTFQRMLVKEGYRQSKGAGKNPDDFADTHWDDPDHPQRRRVQR